MDGPEPPLDAFGIAWRLGATLFFVALNAFFVATEFSLVKVRRTRVAELAEEGHLTARVAHHILEHLDHYLSACQLGVTIASLALGALAEPAVSFLFIGAAGALGWHVSPDTPLLTGGALAFAFLTITALHMILGEQAPKIWALHRAEATALGASVPLRIFAAIFGPFIAAVNALSNGVLRLAGISPDDPLEAAHSSEELRRILTISARGGQISQRDRELAGNILSMVGLEVRHILVPRVDVAFLSLKNSPEDNARIVRESGHSRLPLCEIGLDNVIGIVHAKDVLALLLDKKEIDFRALARPPLFVPDTQPLSQLILHLQEAHSHCAVVVDEHGTATGLAFLEDALEEIVGPIQDEFDEEGPEVRRLDGGVIELSGAMSLPEAAECLDLDLEDESEDTIGGHVVARLGRLPRRGDQLVLGPYRVTVTEVTRRRVGSLRLVRSEEAVKASDP